MEATKMTKNFTHCANYDLRGQSDERGWSDVRGHEGIADQTIGTS